MICLSEHKKCSPDLQPGGEGENFYTLFEKWKNLH